VSAAGSPEGPQGVPARELSDEELEQQGTYAHATRTSVLLHGTATQFRNHTERMLELEQEYIRRHPKRTWQAVARSEDDAAGLDPLSRLRLELRGVMNQIDALISGPFPVPDRSGTTSDPAAAATELLRRFAAADGGRLHKLEAHQLAREVELPPVAVAELYKAEPPLLRAEGDYRSLTAEGRRRVERARP
jgi:hypothetical protein